MQVELAGNDNKVDISERVFNSPLNESLIHQAVVAYMAGARAGTKKQKTRSEVRGGGKKPWRQKGTGHARAGSNRSPLWRGGGQTFAARSNRNYKQKINRKMYKSAMCSILSELFRSERAMAVETFTVDTPRTKEFVNKLTDLKLDDVLIVVDDADENLFLASRNVPKVDIVYDDEVNPVLLLAYKKVIFTVPAMKNIEERLA